MISNIAINLFSFVILLVKIITMATGKLIPKAFIVLTCKQKLLTATGSLVVVIIEVKVPMT